MSTGKTTGRHASAALIAAALVLVGARGSNGQSSTCNAVAQISYISGPSFPSPGDTVRVSVTLGATVIDGGTSLTVNRVRFDLDCAVPPSPGAVGCPDDGLVIGYGGDPTITTTCGVTWSSGHAASGSPNQIVFSASPPLVIAANTTAFCELEFEVVVLGPSNDATPAVAEEVAGFDSTQADGQCDNGLATSTAQAGAIHLCPVCPCATQTCNSSTGGCEGAGLPEGPSGDASCANGVDDDCDGLVDDQDPDCGAALDCSAATANPSELWRPNRRFVDVSIDGVTAPNGDAVTITITGITQDEPLQGRGGAGRRCPDGEGIGTATASLRAERIGRRDGRVYHVSFTAADGHGGSCTGLVTVCVPHDQRPGHACVDQGPVVDSTGPCS